MNISYREAYLGKRQLKPLSTDDWVRLNIGTEAESHRWTQEAIDMLGLRNTDRFDLTKIADNIFEVDRVGKKGNPKTFTKEGYIALAGWSAFYNPVTRTVVVFRHNSDKDVSDQIVRANL